jgi:hypothetical protein
MFDATLIVFSIGFSTDLLRRGAGKAKAAPMVG